ncbi:hypothetical protein A4X03_0g2464 [Tilletia caries]|uniref:Uncharacterized protein n=1 Tax=Tilletia caries TaxID=13290 RepID=A0A8T8TKE3_9BASI|nr:hypothetical protein A4X03_0g2464 [Tilletia caries]
MKLFSAASLAFLLSGASILASPDELCDAGPLHNSSTYSSVCNQIARRAVTTSVNFNAQVEVAALKLKLHRDQGFCSTYLSISPYAATATKFGTATATATAIVPGPTLTQLVRVTVAKTALPKVVTRTTLSVVNYMLTATRTLINVAPTTVTVATVTSLTTVEIPTIVGTVTILTPAIGTVIPRAALQTSTTTTPAARTTVSTPSYLLSTLPTVISRACSRIVTFKTTTIIATRTVTNTITNKASTVRATITDQPVVTPTSTRFVPSISTRTVGTVVVPVTKVSLSTVPATATDIQPTTILIPTSTTIYLPSLITETEVQSTTTVTPTSTTTDLPSTVTETEVQSTTTLDSTTTATDLPSTITDTDVQPTTNVNPTSTTTDMPSTTTETDVQPTTTPLPASTTSELPSTITETDVQPTTNVNPTSTTTDLPNTVTETNVEPTTTPVPTSTTTGLPIPTPSLRRGYLRVRKVSDNSVFGLVRAQLNGVLAYTYTSDISGTGALIVTLPDGWMYGRLMDLSTENGDAIYPRIGVVLAGEGTFFTGNQHALLAPVEHADLEKTTNTHAQNRLGNSGNAESQLWTLNQDLSVTATWVRPVSGGSFAQAPAKLFHNAAVDGFAIVNNLDNFVQNHPEAGALAVLEPG